MDWISVISSYITTILGFVFLIEFISHRHQTSRLIRYGMILAAPLLLFDLLMVLANGGEHVSSPLIIFVSLLTVLEFALGSTVGMYHCAKLRQPAAPLIRGRVNWKTHPNFLTAGIGVALGAVIFTILLFTMAQPTTNPVLESSCAGVGFSVVAVTYFYVLRAAVIEELFYRLILQSWLANRFKLNDNKYWIAIIISSLLWTMSHSGVLVPNWVKFAQIFPLGLAFGYLMRRYGVESAIIAHATFNVLIVSLKPLLYI